MNDFSRREFLKYSGAGLAGLTLAGMNFPTFDARRSFAAESGNAWRFGVMADTQWRTGGNAGGEPASCAVTIIDALNQQFIRHGCKFVVQVGDLVDVEVVSGVRTLPTRSARAQALYNAGIGFFPVRGNHESTYVAANELPSLFPQTLGQGSNLFGATNFASPAMSSTTTDPLGERLKGLSYAFDFGNIRCVLIDQFVRKDNTCYNTTTAKPTDYNNNAVDQVEWVNAVLSANAADRHAFVFSHKNLIGQNHKDVLFGTALTSNAEARDAFLASLYGNHVGYYMGGHDHMHHRSVVKNSGGDAKVDQIICASNSYKFYIPRDGDDDREIPFAQELFTLGYYIVTVDGPRVTVDFYSSSHGSDYGDFDLVNPPSAFNFYLRETFGYSLNGKKFEIARGESYTVVQDTYETATVRILSGTNGNLETDGCDSASARRPLSKQVNTGWSASDAVDGAASPVLTLWGMQDNLSLWDQALVGLLPDQNESKQGDVYTLSLKYNPSKVRPSQVLGGKFVLAIRDEENKTWVNAVDLNVGGVKKFVRGPWRSEYGLGTYGVDPGSTTVWAVINRSGDFVAKLI